MNVAWAGLLRQSLLAATISLVLGISHAAASQAEVTRPWWGVTSGTRPTDLQKEVSKDEVQELTVSATGGEFIVIEPSRFAFHAFKWNVSAAELQSGLEQIYGGVRRVEVSGGPGDEGGSQPYTIVFPGQSVPPPVVSGEASLLGGESLSGGRAEASIVEVAKGVASGRVIVTAENLGDAEADGSSSPIKLQDQLPPGLEAVSIEAVAGETPGHDGNRGEVNCVLSELTCSFVGKLPAFEQIEARIDVVVRPGAVTGDANTALVEGGGAVRAQSASHRITVDGVPSFGVEDYTLVPEDVGGDVDTQAGSHPFQMTSVVTFNSQQPDAAGRPRSLGMPKTVVAELPTGLVGNPTPFQQCTDAQFSKQPAVAHAETSNECPPGSAVGVALVSFTEPANVGYDTVSAPIFNMQPRPGEPARFGFKAQGIVPAFLDAAVRTGSDYGVTITSSNITEIASLLSVKLTFWGVPGDKRHDAVRGWECLKGFGSCPSSNALTPPPFLVMPTSCDQPFKTAVRAESWPGNGAPEKAAPVPFALVQSIDGCDRLPFGASLDVSPDLSVGSAPTGLTVGIHVPQRAALNPEGLSEGTVKRTTIALPEGVALNPSGADGLEACTESEIGFLGTEAEALRFTGALDSPFCPDASKIATVKIRTPLLANPLVGSMYLATQDTNPFGSLVAMYLVAQDPVSGVLVKLPGAVSLDGATGQIVSTFDDTPELPFEDLEVHFFGGERAPLGTPAHCGSYTTRGSLTSWSGSVTEPQSTFVISSGANGKACPGLSLPFSPTLAAGTVNTDAGGFSPLTTTISRDDGEQDIGAVRLRMPSGLAGLISKVSLCGEAEANAGTCGQDSQIGETTVSVGLGGDPFSVTGGKVYITGPYRGAPFGLSIVNPAKAGPFDLGNVVVRAKVDVDPRTAELIVTTDSSGPYAVPHILDGILLQIKHVNVTINRPGFAFNPTNCAPKGIEAVITSDQGASNATTVPFQATNCALLGFKPKFTVTTSGKTSRAIGTSLAVKLSYPRAPFGTQANIAKVKVELPRQLPSRLTTLQKACVAATFEADPTKCGPGSVVGRARVDTPVLPVPLEGPAYFVSHGGEAFPDLTIVLHGDNVTVELVGSTLIKNGITSTTFRTTPDVPFETFTLELPKGRFSALGANGNLCRSSLFMPTTFVAQNGAEYKAKTRIGVSGCGKAKPPRKRKKAARRSKHKRG